MYHYYMYVKVAYDNFNNKRRYDDEHAKRIYSVTDSCRRVTRSSYFTGICIFQFQ